MTERPILFSGEMVRAILDGRKTQTRRVVKLPHNNPLGAWEPTVVGGKGVCYDKAMTRPAPEEAAIWHTRTGDCLGCPYGQPGDRLWVRETFVGAGNLGVLYAADCPRGTESGVEGGWRPSIFMPRWASRLTLEITEVRVQRVQEISRGDAMEEGCPFANMADGPDPRDWFRDLWDSLNAKRGHGWDTNPWVWAITFRAERGPDAGGEG